LWQVQFKAHPLSDAVNNRMPGRNPTGIRVVHRIFELVNNRGVHTAARGFDAGAMFDDRLDNYEDICP